MTGKRVLVVDDDVKTVELVKIYLNRDGYRVLTAYDGIEALRLARESHPDLIVLDLMLPGIDGLEVCKILKKDSEYSTIPIIMLTAKGEESDIVTGFEIGADDYIPKPFSPRVLIARVKAVLRRKDVTREKPTESEVVKIHELIIHPGRHEVKVEQKLVDLTYTEFSLLYFLAQRPGWVFTRYQIVDAVRGDDYPVTDRSVDVQIVGLRKKLGPYGTSIETVRGVGYRFKE